MRAPDFVSAGRQGHKPLPAFLLILPICAIECGGKKKETEFVMNPKTMFVRFVAFALLFAFGFPLANHVVDTGVHFNGGLIAAALTSAAYLAFGVLTVVVVGGTANLSPALAWLRNKSIAGGLIFAASALFFGLATWLAPAVLSATVIGALVGAAVVWGILAVTLAAESKFSK